MGIAAYRGHIQIMEILSERSDMMFTNMQGVGPLFLAIKGNKMDAVRFLLGR